METKKLLLILAVIVGIYVLILTFNKPKIYSNVSFLKIIDLKSVKEINIKNNDEEITIIKKELWSMTQPYNYKANNSELEELLEKLSKVKLYGPLTSKEELYYKFEIHPTTSATFTLKGDKNISILTGKTTMDFSGTFIKFKDSKEIYEAKGIFPFDFKKTSMDLIHKGIVESDIDKIKSYEIEYQKKEISDSKDNEGKWQKSYSEQIINTIKDIKFNKIEIKEIKEEPIIKINLKTIEYEEIIKIYKKCKNYTIAKKENLLTLDEFHSKKVDTLIDTIKNFNEKKVQ